MTCYMLKETGRVVAIEDDALWVETIQKTTCGSCAAQKGCGTGLLAKLGVRPAYLRVLLNGRSATHYHVDDTITLGIPDDVVVKGSLFVYFVPLLLMIVFSGIAHKYILSEIVVVLIGIVGLLLGGLIVRWHSRIYRNDPRLQPQLVDQEQGDSWQPVIFR